MTIMDFARKLDEAGHYDLADRVDRIAMHQPPSHTQKLSDIGALHQIGFMPEANPDIPKVVDQGKLTSRSGLVFLRPQDAEDLFKDIPEYKNMVRVHIPSVELTPVQNRKHLAEIIGIDPMSNTDDPEVAAAIAKALREMGTQGYIRSDFPEIAMLADVPHHVIGLASETDPIQTLTEMDKFAMAHGPVPPDYDPRTIRKDEMPPDATVMYHATTDLPGVRELGLVSQEERRNWEWPEAMGIGGGSPEYVSLTRDQQIAQDIANAMLYMREIISSPDPKTALQTAENIVRDICETHNIDPEPIIEYGRNAEARRLLGSWDDPQEIDQLFDNIANGIISRTAYGFDYPDPNDLPEGSTVIEMSPFMENKVKKWTEPIPRDDLVNILRYYFEFMLDAIERADDSTPTSPMFWGLEENHFMGFDPKDVGVAKVMVTGPPDRGWDQDRYPDWKNQPDRALGEWAGHPDKTKVVIPREASISNNMERTAFPYHATPDADRLLEEGYTAGIPDYAWDAHFDILYRHLPPDAKKRVEQVAEKADPTLKEWGLEYWGGIPEAVDALVEEYQELFPNAQMIWSNDWPSEEQLDSYGQDMVHFYDEDLEELGKTFDGLVHMYHPNDGESSIPGDFFRRVDPHDLMEEGWDRDAY